MKNGTQVKCKSTYVELYFDFIHNIVLCLVNKRPAKGEFVWIEEINSSVKGWMNTDFLERVPRGEL